MHSFSLKKKKNLKNHSLISIKDDLLYQKNQNHSHEWHYPRGGVEKPTHQGNPVRAQQQFFRYITLEADHKISTKLFQK